VSAEIIHGDCLDVMRGMADASVDAVVTDPPYSSGGLFHGSRSKSVDSKYHEGTQNGFTGDNRDQRSWAYWCALWMSECWRLAKDGGSLMVFADWRQVATAADAVQAGGWIYRGIGVWYRKNARPRGHGWMTQHGEFWVWATKGVPGIGGDRCVPGLVESSTVPGAHRDHITQKPVALMQDLVTIAPLDGIVFDPFAGSGSTGVACLNMGRRFIGIEREAAYVEIARKRLADVQPTLGGVA